MLIIKNISKTYNKKTVLKNISFSIEKGHVLGILGPNGSGKTTLINTIALALKPDDGGEIMIEGIDAMKNVKQARKKIGYVPQDIALFEELSIRDNLICWSRLKMKKAKEQAEKIADLLDLKTIYKQKVSTLSGGMKRRVNLAVALLEEPKLLLLDEPFAGMDYEHTEETEKVIKKIAENGASVIISSHIPKQVICFANEVLILRNGDILFCGNKDEFLANSKLKDADESLKNILNKK